MTIYGDKGDTGERELKKSETHFDKFERNQVKKKIVFSKCFPVLVQAKYKPFCVV